MRDSEIPPFPFTDYYLQYSPDGESTLGHMPSDIATVKALVRIWQSDPSRPPGVCAEDLCDALRGKYQWPAGMEPTTPAVG
jgi:hypothetical protein